MKSDMNLTLKQRVLSIDSIITALSEFIDNIKNYHASFSENWEKCVKLRNERKKFQANIVVFMKDFHKYSESQQTDIEMHFFNALKKLEEMSPSLEDKLRKTEYFIFYLFLKREFHKTIHLVRKNQKKMSGILYPDRRKELISSPEMYKKLVDAWGDVACDED